MTLHCTRHVYHWQKVVGKSHSAGLKGLTGGIYMFCSSSVSLHTTEYQSFTGFRPFRVVGREDE